MSSKTFRSSIAPVKPSTCQNVTLIFLRTYMFLYGFCTFASKSLFFTPPLHIALQTALEDHMFSHVLQIAQQPPRTSQSHPRAGQELRRAAQEQLRTVQKPPGTAQEPPRTAQEPLWAAQEPPRAAHAQSRPRANKVCLHEDMFVGNMLEEVCRCSTQTADTCNGQGGLIFYRRTCSLQRRLFI